MPQELNLHSLFEKTFPQENVRKISDVEFAGLLDPLRPENTIHGYAPHGSTVYEIIEAACKQNKIHKRHIKFGVAQIGTRDLERGVIVWKPVYLQQWRKRRVKDGELVRFRLLPRGGIGGGGSKNPIRAIMQIAVTALAVVASVFTYGATLALMTGNAMSVATALAGIGGVTAGAMTGATFAAGVAGLAVTTIGSMLINAIAPLPTPKNTPITSRKESPTYSISAGKNNINAWGRVPVPLGRGRFAPPYAALPYTVVQDNDQYSHSLFCIGTGDVDVSDLRVGDTSVDEYIDIAWEYFKYDPKKPKRSSLFPTGIIQEELNIELLHNEWNTRTTTLCDSANVDLQFNGIGYANNNGSIGSVCVEFQIQTRVHKEGGGGDSEEGWSDSDGLKWYEGDTLYFEVQYDSRFFPKSFYAFVGVDFDKGFKIFSSKKACLKAKYSYLGAIKSVASKRGSGCGGDDGCESYHPVCNSSIVYDASVQAVEGVTLSGFSLSSPSCGVVNISAGWIGKTYGANKFVEICGAQTRTLRKTYEIPFPQKGVYDVRVRRLTEDSEDPKMSNRSFWVALRSISNDYPVNTPYPVNLLALKVKATGQLSGTLDTLSLTYKTSVLDWDKNSMEWVKRYTSNPASLFRHILQDKINMARPQSDNVMDFDSIVEAHEYWDDKQWEFNLVCDSDESVFERLRAFCAAGLASPTMIDGSWGIIIDKPREYIACAFTEANSWDWSFNKTQIILPNEIHCNFINEEHWSQDMRIVPTDEPYRDNYIFEKQDFPGVTNASQVYQLARFHYADAKVRRRFINLRAYDEAVLCTRGDMVVCSAPSVTTHGLGGGRVRKIFLDGEERVVMIETDQAQATDLSGRRFGVQIFNDDGEKISVEILPENKKQPFLKLKNPQKLPIQLGNKYAFGDFGEETFQAIVLNMRYNSDMTCDITLQDYVPLMYGNLDEPIPDWTSPITPPVILSATNVRAYEVWQYDSTSKSGRSYIQVYWNGEAENWNVFVSINGSTPTLYGSTGTNSFIIDPATTNVEYTIYVTPKDTATKAPYAKVNTLGKLAPPSPVLELNGKFYKDTVTLSWEHIPDHDLQGYELRRGRDWESSLEIAKGITTNVYEWNPPVDGTYKFLLKSIDTFGNYSLEAAECILTVDVEKGLNIVVDYEELPNYVDEAETRLHFTRAKNNYELIWTPSMTNMYGPEYTNLMFDDYAGGSENGVYVSKVHDLGIVSDAYLRIAVDYEIVMSGKRVTNMVFPNRTNMVFPNDTNLRITLMNTLKVEYRLRKDDTEWSEWTPYFGVIRVEARYYQIRVSTQNETPYAFTKITRIGTIVDVPDKIVILRDQVIPIEGRTFTLEALGMYPIYVQYVVGVTPLGEVGKYATVTKEKDRFTVQVFDSSGKVGSLVDLEIRGF